MSDEIQIQDSNVVERMTRAIMLYQSNHITPLAIALGPNEMLSWLLVEAKKVQRRFDTSTVCGNGCKKPPYEFQGLPVYASELDGVHVLTDLTGAKVIASYRQRWAEAAPWRDLK